MVADYNEELMKVKQGPSAPWRKYNTHTILLISKGPSLPADLASGGSGKQQQKQQYNAWGGGKHSVCSKSIQILFSLSQVGEEEAREHNDEL